MTPELQITRNDYNKLANLPKINGVELKGNKTSEDLGIGGGSAVTGIVIHWDDTLSDVDDEGYATITNEEDIAELNAMRDNFLATGFAPVYMCMAYAETYDVGYLHTNSTNYLIDQPIVEKYPDGTLYLSFRFI